MPAIGARSVATADVVLELAREVLELALLRRQHGAERAERGLGRGALVEQRRFAHALDRFVEAGKEVVRQGSALAGFRVRWALRRGGLRAS